VHDLAGISDCGVPVEALAERIAHESVWWPHTPSCVS
jgi:hypothetical protein